MSDHVIGPFHIDFTPDGVTFHTTDASNTHTLTYAECYQLLATLYQRRDALYQLSHLNGQHTEGPPTYVYNNVTYVINDDSISVSAWERTKHEEKQKANENPQSHPQE